MKKQIKTNHNRLMSGKIFDFISTFSSFGYCHKSTLYERGFTRVFQANMMALGYVYEEGGFTLYLVGDHYEKAN